MLAAERRTEMGIARCGRHAARHLVETFLFEGSLYDLVAAAVGALRPRGRRRDGRRGPGVRQSEFAIEHAGGAGQPGGRLRAGRRPHPAGRHGVGLARQRAQRRRGHPQPPATGDPTPPGPLGRAAPWRSSPGALSATAGVGGRATPHPARRVHRVLEPGAHRPRLAAWAIGSPTRWRAWRWWCTGCCPRLVQRPGRRVDLELLASGSCPADPRARLGWVIMYNADLALAGIGRHQPGERDRGRAGVRMAVAFPCAAGCGPP